MSDSTLIWSFLDREYPNDHPVIYLYVCGNVRSPNTAIQRVTPLIKQIFYPAISEHIIKTTIIGFLEMKKKLYLKGQIRVKSLY